MKNNVDNSLLFLKCIRESLCLSIKDSPDCTEEKLNKIRNESTDFEVLSMALFDYSPTEKLNHVVEMFMYDYLKGFIVENYFNLSDVISENILHELVFTINPIYPKGFFSTDNLFGKKNNISESSFWSEYSKNTKGSFEDYGKIKSEIPSIVDHDDIEKLLVQEEALKNNLYKIVFEGYRDKELDGKNWEWAITQTISNRDSKASKEIKKLQKAYRKKRIKGDFLYDKLEKIRIKYDPKYEENDRILDIIKKGPHYKKRYNTADHFNDLAKKSGLTSALDWLKSNKKTVSATVLIAIGLYAAYKAYKKKLSKQTCKGLSGVEYEKCMQNKKKQALEAQINELKRAFNSCDLTTNPEKCKSDIKERIKVLEGKHKEI